MTAASATTAAAARAETRGPPRGRQVTVLLVFLVICFAIAISAGFVTRPAVATWYQDIAKPDWTPPPVAFPIVWPILYLLMAVGAWQAWRTVPHAAAGALVPFFVQLALNAAWPYAFFGMANFALGMAIIVALILAVLATMVAFAQRSALAAALLVPYLAWICYAGAINAMVVTLNP